MCFILFSMWKHSQALLWLAHKATGWLYCPSLITVKRVDYGNRRQHICGWTLMPDVTDCWDLPQTGKANQKCQMQFFRHKEMWNKCFRIPIEQFNEYAKPHPFMGRQWTQSHVRGRDTRGRFHKANDKWLRNQDGRIGPSSSVWIFPFRGSLPGWRHFF